jgi:DinB superfamily
LNDDMTEIADLPAAAGASVAALAGYTDLDWQHVPAADLQWSCWQTALHINDALYFYAMQIVYGQPDRYLCTELALDDSASPPRLLAALRAHAELLHRIARSAGPDVRAHHNYGVSDPAGFAAMGVVETLIHTFDVVRALNPADPWRPPAALAAPVIARLFPHPPSGDATDVLLYCCGRASLGQLPRQTQWQWDSTVRT